MQGYFKIVINIIILIFKTNFNIEFQKIMAQTEQFNIDYTNYLRVKNNIVEKYQATIDQS